MDMRYFMKIQNAVGTKNNRERELALINKEMSNHFEDTYDTEEVLINGVPKLLMIIKDSDSDVFKKKIKSRHEDKFNLGDYVIWNNQHWIITSIDPDEKTWNRGHMSLCIIPLRWQNNNGEIIERFAYSEDFSKYSVGVSSNDVLTVGENQYGLLLPIDNETKKLKRDMRFSIDLWDSVCPDIYRITNRKVSLNNNVDFSRGGIMTITLNYDDFNKDKDKLIPYRGKNIWICDYFSLNHPSPPVSPGTDGVIAEIIGPATLKVGYGRTYNISFKDSFGNYVFTPKFEWKVDSDFEIQQRVDGDEITLTAAGEENIGRTFLLCAIADSVVLSQMAITVADVI